MNDRGQSHVRLSPAERRSRASPSVRRLPTAEARDSGAQATLCKIRLTHVTKRRFPARLATKRRHQSTARKLPMKNNLIRRSVVIGALFLSPTSVAAGPVSAHPIMKTIDVKNCTNNAAQASSVIITLEPQAGFDSARFTFRNIATGQLHIIDYPNSGVWAPASHTFTLPGGNYTLKVGPLVVPGPGVPMRNSVQLLYESPISVPSFVNGKCIPPGATTTQSKN